MYIYIYTHQMYMNIQENWQGRRWDDLIASWAQLGRVYHQSRGCTGDFARSTWGGLPRSSSEDDGRADWWAQGTWWHLRFWSRKKRTDEKDEKRKKRCQQILRNQRVALRWTLWGWLEHHQFCHEGAFLMLFIYMTFLKWGYSKSSNIRPFEYWNPWLFVYTGLCVCKCKCKCRSTYVYINVYIRLHIYILYWYIINYCNIFRSVLLYLPIKYCFHSSNPEDSLLLGISDTPKCVHAVLVRWIVRQA